MKSYLFTCLHIIIALVIFIGIPLLFKSGWWMLISWYPALMVFIFLDNDKPTK